MREVVPETAGAATLLLHAPDWPGHRAGQHLDLRLTADDGYQAQRSYSVSSAPEADHVAITVERVDDGEVSPYLVDDVRAGDELEIRGPIGGHFTWAVRDGGPLQLVAGGSGLAPLMAMLRHRAAQGSDVPASLVASARSLDDALYRDELERLASAPGLALHWTLTRRAPPGWADDTRRVDATMLERHGIPAARRPRSFVCGPTPFVETVTGLLVDAGHDPRDIHAERFGPTGGP